MGRRDQRLNLGEKGAGALDGGHDRRAGHRFAAVAQEPLRGILHLGEPVPPHLEDADLVRGAEAVLRRAQDPVLVVAIALQVDHRVDHVLEGARPRDRAVFGHVPDQENGNSALLREAEEPKSALAHLGDAPRRRVER